MALTNFTGAVAVITGGASGIGLATARTLHSKGSHIVLADINTSGLFQARDAISQHNPEAWAKSSQLLLMLLMNQKFMNSCKRLLCYLDALIL